ncbi:hypothetical protein [Aeromonas media]|uniref:hypothetical protein n=1 Tax=Aeromonas media TaxID=651 RepID=UPI003D224BE3
MNELAQRLMDAMQQPSITANTKEEKKNSTFNPHLALCHETNKSANNRHNSLMMKSSDVGLVDLVKSDNQAREFEEFCKTLTDPHVLLDLYLFCKSSGENNFVQSLIDYNKE